MTTLAFGLWLNAALLFVVLAELTTIGLKLGAFPALAKFGRKTPVKTVKVSTAYLKFIETKAAKAPKGPKEKARKGKALSQVKR